MQWAAGSAVLAFVYYALARAGFVVQSPGINASPFWPPSGVALAALLVFGIRLWPGIAAGALLTNLLTLPLSGSGLLASCAIAAGATLEQVVAWALFSRLTDNRRSFERIKDVYWFVAVAAGSCTVASTIGVPALGWAGIIPTRTLGSAWSTWWLGNVAGMLVLAPPLVCWFQNSTWNYPKARRVELFFLVVINITVAELRFGGWLKSEVLNSLPYVIVICLLWAAFRFGPRETSTLAAFSATIAIVHTWQHLIEIRSGRPPETILAPFIGSSLTANQSMSMLQVFISLVTVTSMVLAAAIAERKRFEEELTAAERRFRTIFEQAAVGVALIETVTGRFVRVNERFCKFLGYTVEEMGRMTFQAMMHPKDRQENLNTMQKVLAGEIREFTAEKRCYRKNGSIVWLNLTVSPMRQPHENHEQHIAVIEEITTRKQTEGALRTAHAKLQQLSREVIRVRDSERQHLARELHDEIGQTLAALRFNLQLLSNSGTSDGQEAARFEDSIEIVDRLLAEVRDLSLSLRPPLLNETGLGPALRSYIKEQGSRSGISINFVSKLDETPIAPDLALALFRIAQEALTNAIRHSGAQLILVSLGRNDNKVELLIEDNGVGIETQPPEESDQRPRLGILGMQERTAALGGMLTVRSMSGRGTVVSVQVPSKQPE